MNSAETFRLLSAERQFIYNHLNSREEAIVDDDRDKSCGEMTVDAVLKAVANAVALLIVIGVMALWEFGINPNNNYSVYANGDTVYSVAGVKCEDQKIRWNFQMGEMWYGNDKNHVRLLVWVQNAPEDEPSRVQEIEVAERSSLYLEGCEGKSEEVAYFWSIDRTKREVHLRVRKYEIAESRYYIIPSMEGEGK
ncbi:hypothetical protein IPM65_00240 [Candidatus Roizmanbacteria bacterium]|nr:MAG: hypothetical protein IPM65_00240 [Candidatus Roizmanbacteria bacterium]